eukprot:TRINITY_DN2230_c0_g1_i3.p1 TRINITY_DN2230_c0_g1~~TRINITY_DN2230_c0_g1_i3.p1  ORF type:complete len:234 (+),score=25.79 TRINITY_DN2230_c0_g1_i3:145-846(+)
MSSAGDRRGVNASGLGDKLKAVDWKDVGEKTTQVGHYVVWEVRRIVERIRTHENFSKKAAGSSVLLSFALGITFGVGFALYWFSPVYDLGAFLVFWSFFHLFEWIFVAITSPKELSADSFLINHSLEFTVAIAASFVEYFIELLLFPSMKGTFFLYLGIIITGSGQLLRTISQFHAGASFTHQVQETKRDEHVLVQSGPYRYIRHPGYLGWYWWAVGTPVSYTHLTLPTILRV